MKIKIVLLSLFVALSVAACSGDGIFGGDVERDFPKDSEDQRQERHGKLGGEGGLTLFGGDDDDDEGGNGIGVNSYLWSASLDTISFMPILSADPFGGTIFTDWYEDPKQKGERLKVNLFILDTELRADAIRASVFRQIYRDNEWRDAPVKTETARKIEDAILLRAREIKIERLRRK